MPMNPWEQVAALLREGTDVVVVTIVSVRGSVPGQAGAKAIVTEKGVVSGNLGGGKVEAKAITRAVEMLGGAARCAHETWNLQRDVGMTCGGEMEFLFERAVAAEPWHIAIFGAGHVAQALVPVLATLACRIDVFDTREDWLERLLPQENVNLHTLGSIEAGVDFLKAESFVLCITQGHSSDRPVLRDVLRRFPDVPFLGVIGSASKRAVLMRELGEDGVSDSLLARVVCPVGLPVGGNDPAEIAISIAAQLLQRRQETG